MEFIISQLCGFAVSVAAILSMQLKNIKPNTMFAVFFMAVFLCCSITTYRGFCDIISAIAALTCALALSRTKASEYRIFMLLNGFLWLIYDVSVSAYGMMISHVVTMGSAAVGILRLDFKKS